MSMVKIGDVANIISGFAFKSKLFNEEGRGIPLIRIRDIGTDNPLTFYDGDFTNDYIVKKGDFLISMDGEFKIEEWKGPNSLLNQRVCKIAADDQKLDSKYLYYFLPKELKKIEDTTPFVTVKHLSIKEIKDIDILLPPLKEQIKTAAVLDKVKSLIEKRKEAIVKLDELAQAVFLDLFKDFIANEHFYLDLSEVSNFIDYRGKTPERSVKGVRLITARNVGQGFFRNGIKDYITEELYDNIMTRGFPREKDILFVTEGHTLGFLTRIPKGFKKFAVGQRLISIRCNDKVTPEFLEKFMLLKKFQADLFRNTTGSSAKGIRSAKLKKIKVPVPPIDLQLSFTKFIEKIDLQKIYQEKEIVELEILFQSLLQRAFKGELTINDELLFK